MRDELGYTGALVLSPEGHKWRDVWHVHGLAERFDWRNALISFAHLTRSTNGLELRRVQPGAVQYVMKYALKDESSVHQLIQL